MDIRPMIIRSQKYCIKYPIKIIIYPYLQQIYGNLEEKGQKNP
jgi:hypothetical protein